MNKSFRKIANRYKGDVTMAVASDEDNLVVIRAIANQRSMNDSDKMYLIGRYCQNTCTISDIAEELREADKLV